VVISVAAAAYDIPPHLDGPVPAGGLHLSIGTALISVSDKEGIVELAEGLHRLGVRMLSTGGTHRAISAAGITVREVSDYTGFPEMMDGRVKTLHPKVHGGLLGRRNPDGTGVDASVMSEHGIEPINLVVVNLYPFAATVARPDCTLEEAIENIDIGGPAMLRSAAKNYASVGVVVDPSDYALVLAELAENGILGTRRRFSLAVKAFAHVADYDRTIADYLTAEEAK
jgi:phosphoribosylaminoimidazolecarboxamide formyltransferase/IMP cyclohydrolase